MKRPLTVLSVNQLFSLPISSHEKNSLVAMPTQLDSLNAIVHELQSSTHRDQKETVKNLQLFLDSVVDGGGRPVDVLGQHVCSNVMVLFIDKYIKPCLSAAARGGGRHALRSEVARPLRSIFEVLHKFESVDSCTLPFTWKECRPLLYVAGHITEVLQSDALASRCGQDYANLLCLLLEYKSYTNNLSPTFLDVITFRMLEQLVDPQKTEADEGTAYAAVVAALAHIPHWASSLKDLKGAADLLIAATAAHHHQQQSTSSSMKLQTHLITALRRLVAATQHDFPTVAALPSKIVKVITSMWHSTVRRDDWRIEALKFIVVQLSFTHSDVIFSAAERLVNHHQPPASVKPPAHFHAAQLVQLHQSILPALLGILDARQLEYSFVTGRELAHYPCTPIQPVFDAAALVILLASQTLDQYAFIREQHLTQANLNVNRPGGEAGEGAFPTSGGLLAAEPPQKKVRRNSPFDEVCDQLKQLLVMPTSATTTSLASTGIGSTSAYLWLHTIASPLVSVAFASPAQYATIIKLLLQVSNHVGSAYDHVMTGCFMNLVKQCGATELGQLFEWALQKYVPTSGNDVDDGQPSSLGYDLLSTVLEESIASGHQLVIPQQIAKSAHFHITSRRQASFSAPVVRFLLRVSQATFLFRSGAPFLTDAAVISFVLEGLAMCEVSLSHRDFDTIISSSSEVLECAIAKDAAVHERSQQNCAYLEELKKKLSSAGWRKDALNLPPTVQEACRLHDALLFSGRTASPAQKTPATQPGADRISATIVGTLPSFAVEALSTAVRNVWLRLSSRILQPEHAKSATECSIRIAALLLEWHIRGLWAPSQGDSDIIILRDAPAIALGTSDLLKSLSPSGALVHALGLLLNAAAKTVHSTPSFLPDEKDAELAVEALHHLVLHQGSALLSYQLCSWEPRQAMLAAVGSFGRKLLDMSLTLEKWEPKTIAAQDQSLRVSHLFQVCLQTVGKLVRFVREADIGSFSTDPLVEPSMLLSKVKAMLRSKLLLGDDALQPQQFAPRVLLTSAERVCELLIYMDAEDTQREAEAFLRILLARYRHTQLSMILRTVGQFGDSSISPSVAVLSNVTSLCEEIVSSFKDAPFVPHDVRNEEARCIASLLHRCESRLGASLGKELFRLLGPGYPFLVRLCTAKQVAVPFRTFRSTYSVLQDLLIHSKESLLSRERSKCVTSLVGLTEACMSTPLVEPEVVSSLLEFYATRGFEHQSLILQCLDGIASFRKLKGHAALCNFHAPRLCFDWLWRFGHSIDAFPCACFGYENIPELVTSHVHDLLPIALLSLREGSVVLQKISEVFRTRGDVSLVLRECFPAVMSSLLVFSKLRPTVAQQQESAAIDAITEAATYGLEWVTVQLGSAMCVEMCKKTADSIACGILDRCSSVAHATLPSVTTAVAVQALTKLCALIDCPSLNSFFTAHKGDRAYEVLWHFYCALARSPQMQEDPNWSLIFEQILSGWIGPGALHSRHILETAIHISCSAIAQWPSQRAVVCNVLLFVWNNVGATVAGEALLSPLNSFVATTLLALTDSSHEVRNVWENISRRNFGGLQSADWHRHSSQLMITSQLPEDDAVVAGPDDAGRSAAPATDRFDLADISAVLAALPYVSGNLASNYYRDLSIEITKRRKFIAGRIQDLQNSAQEKLYSGCNVMYRSVNIETEYHSAAKALFKVASGSAHVKNAEVRHESMSAFQALCFCMADAEDGSPRFSTTDVSDEFARDLLREGPEEALVRAFCAIVIELRGLAFDRDPEIVCAASTALRQFLRSDHDFVSRVIRRLEEKPEQFESIAPFARDRAATAGLRSSTLATSSELDSSSIPGYDSDDLWIYTLHQSPSLFIRQLSASLAATVLAPRYDFVKAIYPMMFHHQQFARRCLPVVLLLIAMRPDSEAVQTCRLIISHRIETALLAPLQETTSRMVAGEMENGLVDPARSLFYTIHALHTAYVYVAREVGMKHQLRKAVKSSVGSLDPPTSVPEMLWLDVKALALAQGCAACQVWPLCFKYLELSCENVLGKPGIVQLPPPLVTGLFPPKEEQRPEDAKESKERAKKERQDAAIGELREACVQLLVRCSEKLDDSDMMTAAAACGQLQQHKTAKRRLPTLGNTTAQVAQYSVGGDYVRALQAQDPSYSVRVASDALLRLGCTNTAFAVASSIKGDENLLSKREDLREIAAEAAWRAGQWDFSLPKASEESCGFQESIFLALRACRSADIQGLRQAVALGQQRVVSQLSEHNMFSCAVQYRALRDIRDCGAHMQKNCSKAPRWISSESIVRSASMCELLDSIRFSLCSVYGSNHWWSQFAEKACGRALASGLSHVASRWLRDFSEAMLERDPTLLQLPSLWILRAKIDRECGNTNAAVTVLQQMPGGRNHPEVVRLLAEWSHESQVVPTSSIVTDPSLQQIHQLDETGAASFTFASLCDFLFREIQRKLQSSEFAQYEATLAVTLEEQQLLADSTSSNRDIENRLKQRANWMMKEVRRGKERKKQLVSSSTEYRHAALGAFSRHLKLSGEEDHKNVHSMSRVIALWLSEKDSTTATGEGDDLTEGIMTAIRAVPLHRFIPLYTQLAARLGSSSTALMDEIVRSVALAHPFHTIWTLLALRNGRRLSQTESRTTLIDNDKVEKATQIIKSLLTHDKRLEQIVLSTQVLADAYFELAFTTFADNASKKYQLNPNVTKLLKIRNAHHIPLLTTVTPVDPSGQYERASPLESIVEYKPAFETCGGQYLPKVLQCLTSKGHAAKQLLKSNDDLRQDALIEQLFTLCNTLLAKCDAARHRRLQMRTYVVVPLAPTTGILQFVPDTVRIGDYLQLAHRRYHPNDATHEECRVMLEQTQKKGSEAKRQEMANIWSHFTPVMHHFIIERFHSPQLWLEHRVRYTRSIAVSSIVGYFVGLGDRHASNILLHEPTADVVHIDLGYAFDQSTLLAVPEVVPFRLTRDIIDGMGILGVEGHYRSGCEITMDTLRRSKDLLQTILEAFIHDPLAKWAVGNVAAMDAADATDQKSGAGKRTTRQRTADAERSVARAKEKLAGVEDGETLGVQAHVRKLVSCASSLEKLSEMYPGWSPWL